MVRRLVLSALFCSIPLVLPACGSQSTVTPAATGGSVTKTGGVVAATGGTSVATGGVVVITGGQIMVTGGTAATGGVTVTGGVTATGGKVATGGVVPPDAGTATGGAKTGGAMATGGAVSPDAGTATDTAKTGGALATGGSSAAGGTTTTGGSTSSTAGTGAPETKPVGYGQNTTGGGNGTAVDKATWTDIQAAIDAYSGSGGLVIRYTGKFDFASIPDPCVQHTLPAQKIEIKKKNDITIIGADGSAANFGIHIASSSSNVIIRNMTFGLLPGGGDSDVISVEGMSGGVPKNIWVDHNTLFSSMVTCAGAGDTAFDGLIDIKKGGDMVTISYNYLHDHHKGSLNGFTDDDNQARHVTYHHNIFENIGSRTPLQRAGFSHQFSNYYTQVTVSGINVRMDGYALIESNWFEDSKNIITSRDSPGQGWWEIKATNNVLSPADFAKYGLTWGTSTDTLKNADDWTTTKAFAESLGYTYKPDSAQCSKDGLKAVAGAGKGLATLKCN